MLHTGNTHQGAQFAAGRVTDAICGSGWCLTPLQGRLALSGPLWEYYHKVVVERLASRNWGQSLSLFFLEYS